MGDLEIMILRIIGQRDGVTFSALCVPLASSNLMHVGFRKVDRTLQKLRRAGKVHYFSPIVGWRIGPAKEPA